MNINLSSEMLSEIKLFVKLSQVLVCCWLNLCFFVQIPETETATAVNSCKHRWMSWWPLYIVNVITEVIETVDGFCWWLIKKEQYFTNKKRKWDVVKKEDDKTKCLKYRSINSFDKILCSSRVCTSNRHYWSENSEESEDVSKVKSQVQSVRDFFPTLRSYWTFKTNCCRFISLFVLIVLSLVVHVR
jgi:hypothetical protein